MTYRGDAKGAETKHNAKSTRAEVQKIRFAINFHCTSANESQNLTMLGALTVELAKRHARSYGGGKYVTASI